MMALQVYLYIIILFKVTFLHSLSLSVSLFTLTIPVVISRSVMQFKEDKYSFARDMSYMYMYG